MPRSRTFSPDCDVPQADSFVRGHLRGKPVRSAATLLLLILASGCAGSADPGQESVSTTPTGRQVPTDTVVTIPGGKYTFDSNFGANVTREEFGPSWPLTVPSGRVNCVRSGSNVAVVFTSDDEKRYAVNGIARNQISDMGYLELGPIWAPNPKVKGAFKDIGVLIDICKPLMQ